MTELIPLSPFSDIPGRRWTAPPLSPDKYDPDTLERLMRYLECSPIILPWMECTEDLIGGKFKVLGGSATMSDGKYFWRYEAGMYLRHYPIRVPDEAIAHFRLRRWNPPEFTSAKIAELERVLTSTFEY